MTARVAIAGAAALVVLAASSGSAGGARIERARHLMGTLCTASAEGPDSARVTAALVAALDGIAALERRLSNWRDDSELSRLNAGAHAAPFACSEPLWAVLDSALALAALTDGAFDPTVEPLVRAWDLRGAGRVPDPGTLATARGRIGAARIVRDADARTVTLPVAGAGLDLGGIGKGFALDRAAEALREAGVERALVNLGGEIRTLAGDGEPAHAIAIAHPADRLRPVVTLALPEGAVSTSGQRERGFAHGGAWHGHVLDPRRGAPVPTAGAVTVVAASATRADALSTAMLVAGREGAERFAALHPEIGVLWLEPDAGRVRAWSWNLSSVTAIAGADVEWMHPSPRVADERPARAPHMETTTR